MDNDIKKPKISVVMAVFNSEKYVAEAMQSILDQTLSDFEFLIINDGSTDGSANIVRSFDDARIIFIENEKNMGHTFCLNLGLEKAQGQYIARMDSDDVSLPERFKTQVEFMDSHTDIAVCGTWIRTIGSLDGYTNRFLTEPEDVKANLLFYTSLAHPTVFIRKSVLDKLGVRYSIVTDRNENSEDYGLWVKLSLTEKLANIPKVLFLYRIHKKSVSAVYADKQKTGAQAARKEQLVRLGLSPSEEEMILHSSLRSPAGISPIIFLKSAEEWLLRILKKNQEKMIYEPQSLQKIIYERWRTLCGLNASSNEVPRLFLSSTIATYGGLKRFKDVGKIYIKILLKIR